MNIREKIMQLIINTWINNNNKLWLFLGFLLLGLVAKEAIIHPLTHDEYNTIQCSTTSIIDIISYRDPVPNNHILNTLLIKLSQSIFGPSLFVARLHNVLFFIPFYIFTILISKYIFKKRSIQFLFVFSVVLQPFLLDFFSVTRGYGVSVALQVISLYYLLKNIKEGGSKNLIYCLLFAALGVYANFTLLNYYIPLSVILLIQISIKAYKYNRQNFFKDLLIVFSTGLILLLIIIIPIMQMVSTKQFVYWATNGFIHDTVRHLFLSLRAGVQYWTLSDDVTFNLFLVFISIVFITGFTSLFTKKTNNNLSWSITLLFLVIFYNLIQFYLLDVPFLNARTALFFIPLVCLPFCLIIDDLNQNFPKIGFIIVIMLNSLFLQHFIRGFRVNANFEWYYDQNTYQVLDLIKELVVTQKVKSPARVNCKWIFYPSLSYHVANGYSDVIKIAPWNTKIESDSISNFYYTEWTEKEALSTRFKTISEYGYNTRCLMISKEE